MTNAKCISQYNLPFFQCVILCSSQDFLSHLWRKFWLRSKPHMHCILNIIEDSGKFWSVTNADSYCSFPYRNLFVFFSQCLHFSTVVTHLWGWKTAWSSRAVLPHLNLSTQWYTFFCTTQCSLCCVCILLQISNVVMLYDHKTWNTIWCSILLYTILKWCQHHSEDLSMNTKLTNLKQTCRDNGWYVVNDTTARFCSVSIEAPL